MPNSCDTVPKQCGKYRRFDMMPPLICRLMNNTVLRTLKWVKLWSTTISLPKLAKISELLQQFLLSFVHTTPHCSIRWACIKTVQVDYKTLSYKNILVSKQPVCYENYETNSLEQMCTWLLLPDEVREKRFVRSSEYPRALHAREFNWVVVYN